VDGGLAGVLALAVLLLVPGIASRLPLSGGPQTWWSVAMVAALLAIVGWLTLTAVRGDDPAPPARALIAAMSVVLLTYSLTTEPQAVQPLPWVDLLVPTTVGACAVACRGWSALIAGGLVTGLYTGLSRTDAWVQAGPVTLEGTLYLFVLLTAAIIIVSVVRDAAARVGSAAQTAMQARALADSAEAEAQERVRWESLVHDDILAALTIATTATLPNWDQAVSAAQVALQRLNIDPRGGPANFALLSRRLREAVQAVDPETYVTITETPPADYLPGAVADAIVAATVEGVRNGVRHARRPDGRARIRVSAAFRAGGIIVEVRDNGQGFRNDTIPQERLGLRVSIRQRLRAVGGDATWTSSSAGTLVMLTWHP